METVKKYKSLPREVEAIYYNGNNLKDVELFVGENNLIDTRIAFKYFILNTGNGNIEIYPDIYIVKDIEGKFYPCRPEIFHKMYVVNEL